MADDDHLLVVAAEREHPLVQQHLTARPVDGEGERPVRTHLRAHHAGVGVPQQPTHPRPPTGRPGQRLADRRAAVGEELIGIPPPPHELDRVAVARRSQRPRQCVVVHASVHQRADGVALGPCPEAGSRIAALELGEEPVRDRTLPGLPDPESGSHQRQELLAVRRPDHGRAAGTRARRQIDLRPSTSNTCRNPSPQHGPGGGARNRRIPAGRCPPSSPRSTHRTFGIRSARSSIPASLRVLLPPTTHRGTKLRPVVSSVPGG